MTDLTPAVAEVRPCIKCGYNLQGLPATGNCPECATPIERSLRGDLLAFSDAAYLRALLRGVTFIMAGILLVILNFIIGIALVAVIGPGATILSGVIGLAASGISIYGYYLYSSPDPGQLSENRGEQPRRIVRIMLLVSVVAAIAQFVLLMIGDGGAGMTTGSLSGAGGLQLVASAIGGLAWIVQYFAVMLYTRWLAPRIPSERIAKRAKLLMWLGPVLFVFFLCFLAPLIAMIMYYNMFSWMRKDLIALLKGAEPPSVAAMMY
ncbi:MAG: hypothetical protein KF691_00350 [Phycisphaeraceae bacterium]|nr:hypothetical protein [Phycisphaeraceae bacterium]